MRRFIVGLLLAVVAPCIQAQPADTARMRALEEKVAFLEQFVGTQFVGKTSAELAAALNPSSTLPGGRYPLFLSDYQIRVGLAGIEGGVQAQVTGALQRIAALEGNSGNNPIGTLVAGKLILGQCAKSDQAAQISICGSDASLYMESNTDGTQFQNPSRHYGMFGMSSDGGIRILQNQYVSTQCVPAVDNDAVPPQPYMDCLKTFVDPTREIGLFGPDSRAQFSIKLCSPNKPCPRTQTAVFKMYEDQNLAGWELWRPGLRWVFTVDGKYGPAQFYKPPQQ
jgi:hypothetical protein